jgi:hypothetical protein
MRNQSILSAGRNPARSSASGDDIGAGILALAR